MRQVRARVRADLHRSTLRNYQTTSTSTTTSTGTATTAPTVCATTATSAAPTVCTTTTTTVQDLIELAQVDRGDTAHLNASLMACDGGDPEGTLSPPQRMPATRTEIEHRLLRRHVAVVADGR
jgi:hypothetical protein